MYIGWLVQIAFTFVNAFNVLYIPDWARTHIHPLSIYIRFPFIFAFFLHLFYDFFPSLMSLFFAQWIWNITSSYNIPNTDGNAYSNQDAKANTHSQTHRFQLRNGIASIILAQFDGGVSYILMWCEVELRNCVASEMRERHMHENQIYTLVTHSTHTTPHFTRDSFSYFGWLTLRFQYDFCQYSHWNFVSFRILLYIYVVVFFTCFFIFAHFKSNKNRRK